MRSRPKGPAHAWFPEDEWTELRLDIDPSVQPDIIGTMTDTSAVAYESPAGPIASIDLLYGHRPPMAAGNLYKAHRCSFHEGVLSGTLQAVGFATVASCRRPAAFDLWALASRAQLDEPALHALARAYLPVG